LEDCNLELNIATKVNNEDKKNEDIWEKNKYQKPVPAQLPQQNEIWNW
jgi:hypothetical protein